MIKSHPMRWFLSLAISVAACAQTAPFTPPEDISFRRAIIVSEGTRMYAEVIAPKAAAGKKLPTILMAHGWGGTAALLRPDAIAFARAGYLAVTFDYRGWGDSDSRVILTAPEPHEHPNGRFTAEVQEVREVVDPMDEVTDWFNAIAWLQAEPQFDPARLGLWGSSFSGGLVVYVAEHDARVKAIHSQVGAMDGREMIANDTERRKTYEEATKMARGELGYPAPGVKAIGNLRGAPVRSKFVPYDPVEDVNKAPQCAMQFVIAEKEELFDNKDHALKAYQRFNGVKNLVVIPNITHYGIYFAAHEQAQKLAIEWFDKHLKP
jgi:dienelactone hydrolase